MNSFKDAFTQGIQQAEIAAENIAEINEVLMDLTDSIAESSNGKVEVSVEVRSEIDEDDLWSGALNRALLRPQKLRKYLALVAKSTNDEGSNGFEICEWNLSDKGYPVNIKFSGNSSSFNDKESLKRGLSRLISTPSSGKIFKKLMDL